MSDSEQESTGYEFLSKFDIDEIKRVYEEVAQTGTGRGVWCPSRFEDGTRLPNLIEEFQKGFMVRVDERAPHVEIALDIPILHLPPAIEEL